MEFRSEEDAEYTIKALNMIKLFGKPIRVNKNSQDKRSLDVGANLFVGNLDPDVDEKLLYDTFSAFGVIVTSPKIMRDPETGNSRGFGFVSFDSFEASDAAIEAMSGQYLCNRQITVSYAYKKEPKSAMANGGMAAPVPPRSFANGGVGVAFPPQGMGFPPMQVAVQPTWQGQQPQQPMMTPLPMQQFSHVAPNMPPPPMHLLPGMCRHRLRRPLQLLHGLFHLLWRLLIMQWKNLINGLVNL
ncbi:hypothetical protein ACLB2K_071590 [Fragaria x ananassa]